MLLFETRLIFINLVQKQVKVKMFQNWRTRSRDLMIIIEMAW